MLLWDAHVAREASHEARIEAAFDQAEAHADAGHFEQALEWLSEAEDLAGGLPDGYIELREAWISYLAPLAVVVRAIAATTRRSHVGAERHRAIRSQSAGASALRGPAPTSGSNCPQA